MNIWLIVLFIIIAIIFSFLTLKVINGGAIELPNGYVDASNIIGRVRYSGGNIIAYKNQSQFKFIFNELPINKEYEMKAAPCHGDADSVIFKTETRNGHKGIKKTVAGYAIRTKDNGGFVIWIKHKNGKADDFIFALDENNNLVLTNGIVVYKEKTSDEYYPELDLYKNAHGTYVIKVDQIKYYPNDNIVYLKSDSKKIFSITNKNNSPWYEVQLISDYYKFGNIHEHLPRQFHYRADKCNFETLFSKLPDMKDSSDKIYKIADKSNFGSERPMTTLLVNEELFRFKKLDITEFPN